jgi:uncharacterized protein
VDFALVPATAAWRHRDARAGFEVACFQPFGEGRRVEGWTTAVGDGGTWAVGYVIGLDGTGATRSARVRGRSAAGFSTAVLEADGAGRRLAGGVPAPHLDGCLDVDLESSAMTSALPVGRVGLAPGARAAAPAACVRAVGLAVERLEQAYLRAPDEAARRCYDYAAPAFGFTCRLTCGQSGLVLDYPGIAVRAG